MEEANLNGGLVCAPSSTIIFVGGVHGRTGTSLVKRLLCGHPDVSPVSGGETRMLEAVCDLWPTLLEGVAYTPAESAKALASFAQHVRATLGDTPELNAALGRLADALGALHIRLPGRPRVAMPLPQNESALAGSLGSFLLDAFAAAALHPSRPILCEKTPSNALYIERLWRLLPTARVVVLTRDPVAVSLSHTQRDWGPTDPVEAASYTAAYFKRWRRMAAYDDERCLMLNHEDLVARPEISMAHVLEHFGLARSESVLQRARREVRPSLDRRPVLSAAQLVAVREHLSEEIGEHGYDDR